MFLYGASGHGRVVVDLIISSTEWKIEGIYDDFSSESNLLGFPIIKNKSNISQRTKLIISIGNNLKRKEIAENIDASFISCSHTSSYISEFKVKIGSGSVFMANSVINANTSIGSHCIINTGAIIEHDCILEDYVHISPNATVTGGVTIEEGVHIGAGAVILPGIKIGKWSQIGAGSIVTKDVPENSIVVGNPGRVIKSIKVLYD